MNMDPEKGTERRAMGLLTYKEASDAYGVSERQIRDAAKNGYLEKVTPVGSARPVMVRKKQVEDWIRGC